MAQKNHITYVQPKGAPAGSVVDALVIREALARWYYQDLPADAPTNIAINPLTGLVRIHAIGGGIFMAAKEDVTKSESVQATVVLTLADNPTHGDTMQIGEQEYVFKSALTAKALATLALTGVITPGKHAESVVTANTIIDGSQITIGEVTYTFKTTLTTDPATVPNEVLIGANDAAALDNLKLAINHGSGEGTNYSTGTVAHPDVVATDNADTTQKVVARVPGTAANTLATTSLDATLSWPAATLGDGTGASNPGVAPETVTVNDKTYSFVDVLSETNGATAIINQVLFGADSAAALDNLKSAVNGTAGEGTTYSTGTEQPTDVLATTNTNTEQTFEAQTIGPGGNAYPVATDIANGSFGEGVTTFEGGYSDDGKTIVLDSSAAATQTRVRAAINGTGTPGTDYSSALAANELVTCGAFSSDDATITAQAAGADGNGIESTETFTSSNNFFSAEETEGGVSGANFDAYIPSGQTVDFGIDESVSQLSFMAEGASTDIVVVEY
jgi:hypothetical protein